MNNGCNSVLQYLDKEGKVPCVMTQNIGVKNDNDNINILVTYSLVVVGFNILFNFGTNFVTVY